MQLTDKLPITFGLSFKIFKDFIVAMMEYQEGSNDAWFLVKDLPQDFIEYYSKNNGNLFKRIAEFIWLGGEIPIWDTKNENKQIGSINLTKIQSGFALAAVPNKKRDIYFSLLGSILIGDCDLESVDIVFQLCVFGKQKYNL